MGCASSVPVAENGVANGEVNSDTMNHNKINGLHYKPSHEEKSFTMATENPHGLSHPNGNAKSYPNNTKVSSNGIPAKLDLDKSAEDPCCDTELNECEDTVDSSLKPVTHKKEHATQDTLNFVYQNSLTTSPSHAGGSFPLFSGGTYTSLAVKNLPSTQRRPSGVPPPVRELKPGDFLYQKTVGMKSDMFVEEEEEEDDKT